MVYLVRHAVHDRVDRVLCGRMPGVHLSAAGRDQAAWLAERLRREPVAAVRSSPRERAMETAAPIAEALGLPLAADEAFDELDVGSWAGMPFSDLAADNAWQRWNESRDT